MSLSLSLCNYSAIKTAAPLCLELSSLIYTHTHSLTLSPSLCLFSYCCQCCASTRRHSYWRFLLFDSYISPTLLPYTHTHTHTLVRGQIHEYRHTHTNVRSQFTAVFCFSPLSFSIAFVLTRSLRRLPYAHPSSPPSSRLCPRRSRRCCRL